MPYIEAGHVVEDYEEPEEEEEEEDAEEKKTLSRKEVRRGHHMFSPYAAGFISKLFSKV